MAKQCEKIVVYSIGDGQWMWTYSNSRGERVATSYYEYSRRSDALRSARAYARKFIVPPLVIVEDNE